MTRHKWTTDEQEAWLQERRPAFLAANQVKRAAKDFFPGIKKAFREKWPPPSPTPEQIRDAGSVEMAARVIRDAYDERTKTWFPNHCRTAASAVGSSGILKVKTCSQPKKLQSWQAYHALTYESKWKPHINKKWAAYVDDWKAANGNVKPPKKRFEIMCDFIQEKFKEETAEMKKKCELYRDPRTREQVSPAPAKAPAKTEDEVNREYQKAIDKLPRTLATIGESLMKQTGWNISILAGGPTPGEEGMIMTFLSHAGKSKDGKSFEKFLGKTSYDENILMPFEGFLNASFNSEDCKVRRLGTAKDEDDKEKEEIEEEMGDDEWRKQNETVGDNDDMEEESEDNDPIEDFEDAGNVRKRVAGKSQYEIDKERNVAHLKTMLAAVKDVHPLPDVPQKPASTKKVKKKDAAMSQSVARRTSTRNKDVELDSTSIAPTTSDNATSGPPNDSATEPPTTAAPTVPDITTSNESPATVAPTTPDTTTSTESPATVAPAPDIIISTESLADAASTTPNTTTSTEIPATEPSEKISSSTATPSQTRITRPSPAATPTRSAAQAIIRNSILSSTSPKVTPLTPLINKIQPRSAIAQAPDVDVAMDSDITTTGNFAHKPTGDTSTNTQPSPHEHARDSVSSTAGVDCDVVPTWLSPMIGHLRGVSKDPVWQQAVTAFVHFEAGVPPKGKLPTKLRPKEVSDWIKSKKKDVIPTFQPTTFGKEFTGWWRQLQPSWRTSGDAMALTRDVPNDETWSILKKGGTAGIYIVIMGLSWWVAAQENVEPQSQLWSVIDDLSWVLQQMTDNGSQSPTPAQKRGFDGDADSESEPPNSRRRLC